MNSTYESGQNGYITLVEEVLDELLTKQHYLVEFGATQNSCKILAVADNAIGTVWKKDAGNPLVVIKLLGSGNGSTRFVAGGAIAHKGTFIAAVGGKVTASATGRILGTCNMAAPTVDTQVFEALNMLERR